LNWTRATRTNDKRTVITKVLFKYFAQFKEKIAIDFMIDEYTVNKSFILRSYSNSCYNSKKIFEFIMLSTNIEQMNKSYQDFNQRFCSISSKDFNWLYDRQTHSK